MIEGMGGLKDTLEERISRKKQALKEFEAQVFFYGQRVQEFEFKKNKGEDVSHDLETHKLAKESLLEQIEITKEEIKILEEYGKRDN